MWDRTGDSRYNSNSTFLAKGLHTFDEMCALAQEHFPNIWARINQASPVVLVVDHTRPGQDD